jgi:hypothetical protein
MRSQFSAVAAAETPRVHNGTAEYRRKTRRFRTVFSALWRPLYAPCSRATLRSSRWAQTPSRSTAPGGQPPRSLPRSRDQSAPRKREQWPHRRYWPVLRHFARTRRAQCAHAGTPPTTVRIPEGAVRVLRPDRASAAPASFLLVSPQPPAESRLGDCAVDRASASRRKSAPAVAHHPACRPWARWRPTFLFTFDLRRGLTCAYRDASVVGGGLGCGGQSCAIRARSSAPLVMTRG